MKIKKLGSTNLELSIIGLGTWAMGGGGWKFSWGYQDDKESISTIRRAIELGINWIDTAPVYGLGHSEEVVGKAIRNLNDKPIIATKCGLIWEKNRKISECLNKKSIRREVESSLRRLKTDVIDLYQIHWPMSDKDIEEAWSTMADLVKKGKIRYAGVSNFNIRQLKLIQKIHPVASLQPPYSMLDRSAAELFDLCTEKNIGVITYSPMQKGLLSGKFTKERMKNLPNDDHRRKTQCFMEPELSINLKLVEDLRGIARKSGKTVAQLAILWVIQNPNVTSAIVGARHPSQIEENAVSAELELSAEEIRAIEKLLSKHREDLY